MFIIFLRLDRTTFSAISVAALLSTLLFVSNPALAAGELDTTFGRGGVATLAWHGGSTRATALLRQTTGKLVIAVQADDYVDGTISLVRVNANGTIDTTFGDSGVSRVTVRSDYAHSYALMPNNDILVGNQIQGPADGTKQMGLVRLDRDTGQLVPTFGLNGFAQLPSVIPLIRTGSGGLRATECSSHRVTVSNSGFIYLAAGCFGDVAANAGLWIAKLDGTTGAPVNAFGVNGVERVTYETSANLPDGIVVIPSSILITPDNALAVAVVYPRSFSSVPDPSQFRSEIAVTKLDAVTGTTMSAFGTGGTSLLPDHFYPAIDSASYQPGSIPQLLASATALFVSGRPQQNSNSLPFAKLNIVTGSLLTSFGTSGIADLPTPNRSYCASSPERVGVRIDAVGDISLVLRFNDGCSDLYAATIDASSGALRANAALDGYSLIENSNAYSQYPFLTATATDGGLVMAPRFAEYSGSTVSIYQLAPNWKAPHSSLGTFLANLQLARTLTITNACRLQGHDGTMYFAGSLQLDGETAPRMRVTRMMVDGRIDTAFGTNGLIQLDLDYVAGSAGAPSCRIAEDRIGNVYVFGLANPPNQFTLSPTIAKLTTGGQLVASFGQGGYAYQTQVPRTLNVKSVQYLDSSLYLVGENDGPTIMGLAGRLDAYLLKIDAVNGQRSAQFGNDGYVLIRGAGTETQSQYSVDTVWAALPYANAIWVFGRFQSVVGGAPASSARFISRFNLLTGVSLEADHLRFPNASPTSEDAFLAATIDGSGDRFAVSRMTLTRHAFDTGQPVANFGSASLLNDISACAVVSGRNHVYVLSPQALRAFEKTTGTAYAAFGLNGSIAPVIAPLFSNGDCSMGFDSRARLTVFGNGSSAAKYMVPTEYCSLDVDASGGTLKGTTDGLLLLRAMLGLSGTALTQGIVASQGNAIGNSIASDVRTMTLLGALDVDGDGVVRAETDGLLILRMLLGFTGSTVTVGVTDLPSSTATRKTWQALSDRMNTACSASLQ